MKSILKRTLVVIVAILVLGGGAYIYAHRASNTGETFKTPEEKGDVYVRFVMEAYDSIKENYWELATDQGLAGHFQLSLQKAENSLTLPALSTTTRAGVAEMLSRAFSSATSTDAKKNLALNTLNVALYNLQPIGRNGLLSQKQETAFREQVANINPNKDLYQDLGLSKGASEEEVKVAYEEKAKELAKDSSPEAKEKLEKLAYAKSVLANPNTKDLYDEAKVEPTAMNRVIGKTLYIKIDRIAPTSLIEFGRAVYSASTTPLDSMIVDFRGNLGGALDFANAFLGLFMGQNQFAYDFYRKGEYVAQRTTQGVFPELSRFKEVALLTDGMSQSTAEVTAAAFKRFKLGTVVGETTRGWGTVENTFPLNTAFDDTEKYLLLLVHSITLRDDNQPTEGRGIEPDISIKNPNWRSELSSRFKSESLIKAIRTVMAK